MSKQQEALRMADELDEFYKTDGIGGADEAAAELRRLHALCEEMGEALERISSRSMSMYAKREDMNSDMKRIAAEALAKWKESK